MIAWEWLIFAFSLGLVAGVIGVNELISKPYQRSLRKRNRELIQTCARLEYELELARIAAERQLP